MENLSQIQKLDALFTVIKNNNGVILEHEITEKLKPVALSTEEFLRCIEKLITDKYVTKYIDEKGRAVLYYCSFDGFLFDGYEEEKRFKDLEKNRLEIAIIHQREQSDNLTRLTFWIALASIMAAVYYLYLLFQSLCSCQFVWQK